MQKNVITINDELGTIALGFSKAGYNVEAVCFEFQNKVDCICEENWGALVKNSGNSEFVDYIEKETVVNSIDCIAGRIKLDDYSIIGKEQFEKGEKNLSQIIYMIEKLQPRCFILQCNRLQYNRLQNHIRIAYPEFYKRIEKIGYKITIEWFDTRFVTGFPVEEKQGFIIGAVKTNDINLELLSNQEVSYYAIDDFLLKAPINNKWYYKVNERLLPNLENISDNCLLCWKKDRYCEVQNVKWNLTRRPLIVQKKFVRKISNQEIARLKGIPDEYKLEVNNKTSLYHKLIQSSNVQLIQQLAASICLYDGEQNYFNRKISKLLQFKHIILEVFEQSGMQNSLDNEGKSEYIDFQYQNGEKIFNFVFKIYNNNYGIENRIIEACKSLNEMKILQGTTIIIVGNIVENETKRHIEKAYNIVIWDIENILWILEAYPELKTDFMSLLSFNISNIISKEPKQEFFLQGKGDYQKIDLQEQLRVIKPGKEDKGKYEKLCVDIIKYLFAESLEFYGEQRISNDKLYRFDYCGKIKSGNSSEFFETIQRYFGTKFIIFEFKNYVDTITQKEVYTTEKYLYETALRMVAIIISRKGMDTNAKKAARGSLREQGKIILCLSDEDINKLIVMRNSDEEPADYLEVLLDNMLLELEK